jgi:transcriptional regulator with XRE-family HTH domain
MATSAGDPILRAFGTILRDCRIAAHQSQIDLAGNAALNRDFISALETARKEPGLRTLLKLARGLAVSSGEILGRTEKVVFSAALKDRIARNTEAKIPLGFETCPGCKVDYALYARRLKRRERGKFKCPRCKTQLATWLGTTELVYETHRLPKVRPVK